MQGAYRSSISTVPSAALVTGLTHLYFQPKELHYLTPCPTQSSYCSGVSLAHVALDV